MSRHKGDRAVSASHARVPAVASAAIQNTTLTPAGCLLVRGAATGPIIHLQDVHIAAEGRISGAVSAKRIVVDGEVKGDLRAEISIHVGAAGRIHGALHAPRIDVQPGAQLCGRIHMQARKQDVRELDEASVDGLLTGRVR